MTVAPRKVEKGAGRAWRSSPPHCFGEKAARPASTQFDTLASIYRRSAPSCWARNRCRERTPGLTTRASHFAEAGFGAWNSIRKRVSRFEGRLAGESDL